jgi:histidyl-tRNA synthetase
MDRRRQVESQFRSVSSDFGFKEIMTPTFEHLDLFTTKSGPSIIEETYSFKDKGGRDVALRPEFTPSVARMYIDSMQQVPKPIKLFYFGPCFRYDEPQKGRWREFLQFGAEIIGGDAMSADAEIIALAIAVLERVGLKRYEVRVGNIGLLRNLTKDLPSQQRILQALDKKDFEKARTLLETNNALELEDKIREICSIIGGPETIEKAKSIAGDSEVFGYLEKLVKRLDSYGIKDYKLDFGVVRGLDYYTGMVFEIDCPDLGAEKQVCGGGSYALIKLFGGEDIFATGFGMGFGRIILALEEQKAVFSESRLRAYVIPMEATLVEEAVKVATTLRNAGIPTDVDLSQRTPSKSLKYAGSIGAESAILLKPEEWKEEKVIVRDLDSGEQEEANLEELVGVFKKKG